MLGENFVYFFTVQGFFVGIIFGILKSLDAEGLLTYTFVITTFFYLFSHVIIAFYFRTITTKSQYFPKEFHEEALDSVVREIVKREKVIDTAYEMTEVAIKINKEDHIGKQL